MKKAVIAALVVLVVIIAVGVGGWYFFLKKSAEGGSCRSDTKCETGLKCISNVCSSGNKGSKCAGKSDCKTEFCVEGICTEGKLGDKCIAKSDCRTGFCVNERCTEGKVGQACGTYKDCQSGLLCKSKLCTEKPSYTKYFDRIDISKMKPGLPPGPDNIPVATTEFKKTDAIEIDITNSKKTNGEFYIEVIDPISGEKVFTTDKQQISGSRGTGFGLPMNTAAGEYELDVYFNNELIYSVPIKISS